MVNDTKRAGFLDRFLNTIEVVGNRLPDPAVLFLVLMASVASPSSTFWRISALSLLNTEPRSWAETV